MTQIPLISIVIDNYNYARYLREAIDSALAQTYPNLEVVVVDDGSTDSSRNIIASYGNRIVPVLKSNGGQGSAFNAGFAASHGAIVIFLDSDDVLLPTAAERAAPFFRDPEVVKVHWPLWLIDAQGRGTGRVFPGPNLAEGDLRDMVLREGPTHHLSAPTSGNAWRRDFLKRLFPLPEDIFSNGCDTCMFETAPFFGKIGFVPSPQSFYRQHGANDHNAFSMEDKIGRELKFYDHYTAVLERHCGKSGITVDLERWRRNSWWHRQSAAVQEIGTLPRADAPLILVDDATWEQGLIRGRRRIPFLERDGAYFGIPADDETAIQELERLREHSHTPPSHIIFAWSCFWWLSAFPDFAGYLKEKYQRVLQTSSIDAFDIHRPTR